MLLSDLKIGQICVYESSIVEVLAKYEGRTPDRDVLIKSLATGEEVRGYSTSLVSLEEADHKLFLQIKQAETLRQEVKSQLYLQYQK